MLILINGFQYLRDRQDCESRIRTLNTPNYGNRHQTSTQRYTTHHKSFMSVNTMNTQTVTAMSIIFR